MPFRVKTEVLASYVPFPERVVRDNNSSMSNDKDKETMKERDCKFQLQIREHFNF